MHRVSLESWLTGSANRSVARRAEQLAFILHRAAATSALDKQCLLIEVRYPQATPRNTKDTLFGGCGTTHDLGTVHHKRGQRLRIASRRTWTPKERGAASQWCNRLPHNDPLGGTYGEEGVVCSVVAIRFLPERSSSLVRVA